MEDTSVQVERLIPHPPSVVWQAVSTPEGLARWWAGGPIAPVEGHTFALDMGPWGAQPCCIEQVIPERLLVMRFATTSLNTPLSFCLTPEGDGTRFVLRHWGFRLDDPQGSRAYQGMKSGWPMVVGRLVSSLSAGSDEQNER